MTQEKRLKDAKAAANEGDIRVFQTHHVGDVTFPRVSLRYTPGYEPLASLGRSTFQVMQRLSAAVIGGVGIQPERLNAEGDSPSALSRGWSVSVTLGMPGTNGKASERRESSRQGSRNSRLSDASNGVT